MTVFKRWRWRFPDFFFQGIPEIEKGNKFVFATNLFVTITYKPKVSPEKG